MISILIASRLRPHLLDRAISSALHNARRPIEVEFVLKVDRDDAPSIEIAERWNRILGDRCKVNVLWTQLGGYHGWWNLLADQAHGDWLHLSNDDIEYVTPDWDEILLSHTDFDLVSPPYTQRPPAERGDGRWPAYPFLRRWIAQAWGHVTMHGGFDRWMDATILRCPSAKIARPQNLLLRHERDEEDPLRPTLLAWLEENRKYPDMGEPGRFIEPWKSWIESDITIFEREKGAR